MAFEHSGGTQIVVGQTDYSPYLRSVDTEVSVVAHDVTTLPKTAVNRFAGLDDGRITLGGLWDSAADAVLAPLIGSAAGEQVIAVLDDVPAVGSAARLGTIRHASYRAASPVGDMVGWGADLVGENGLFGGRLLAPFTARTGTVNLAGVDRWEGPTAATSLGGTAILIVTAFTATTVTVKVQHSTDNVTYADLVTFTAITALGTPGTERVNVAVGTTINRYLRAAITAFTGTTVTFGVAFYRRTR